MTFEKGMTIAGKIREMRENGEPLKAGTGMMYNETWEEGVNPATDVRTDKHELQERIMNSAASKRSKELRDFAQSGKGGGKETVEKADTTEPTNE